MDEACRGSNGKHASCLAKFRPAQTPNRTGTTDRRAPPYAPAYFHVPRAAASKRSTSMSFPPPSGIPIPGPTEPERFEDVEPPRPKARPAKRCDHRRHSVAYDAQNQVFQSEHPTLDLGRAIGIFSRMRIGSNDGGECGPNEGRGEIRSFNSGRKRNGIEDGRSCEE